MVEGILKDARGAHMTVKDSLIFFHNKKKKNTLKKTKQRNTKVGKGKCI